jgi:APA family basic amino acid/polyamine antiporter
MTAPDQPPLVRALGRWTMVGLVINGVIGSGIFGLPDDLVRLVGHDAPLAYLLATAGIAVIHGRLRRARLAIPRSGRPLPLCPRGLRPLLGHPDGLVHLAGAADGGGGQRQSLRALSRRVLAPPPPARDRASRCSRLTCLAASCSPMCGASATARVCPTFSPTAKLVPIALLIVAGLLWSGTPVIQPAVTATPASWLSAVLVLLFAFGGF